MSLLTKYVSNVNTATQDAIRAICGINNGVLNAQVSHRTNTLANLLVLADGGDGEIAIATDVSAIVSYDVNGDPTVHYAGSQLHEIIYETSGTIAESGTAVVVPISQLVRDTTGTVDQVTDTFTLPEVDGKLPMWINVDLRLQNLPSTIDATKYMDVKLDCDLNGNDVYTLRSNDRSLQSGQSIQNFRLGIYEMDALRVFFLNSKFRLRFKHTSGSQENINMHCRITMGY